jgi:hypothetical protein
MRKAPNLQIYDGDSITVCVYIRGYRRLTCRLAELDAAELKDRPRKDMTPGRLFCRTYVFLVTIREYTLFSTRIRYVDMM